jgi:hypothetical protein
MVDSSDVNSSDIAFRPYRRNIYMSALAFTTMGLILSDVAFAVRPPGR